MCIRDRHDKEHAFPDAAFGMLGLETALAVVAEVAVRTRLLLSLIHI